MILEEGFAWNGQTFGSLSQIAKAMTGAGEDRLAPVRPTLLEDPTKPQLQPGLSLSRDALVGVEFGHDRAA